MICGVSISAGKALTPSAPASNAVNTSEGVAARKQIRDLVVQLNARLQDLLGDEAAGQLLEGLAKLNELLETPDQLVPPNWAPQPESLVS